MRRSSRLVLDRHVERFNAGVRSGDFGPMLDGFADAPELWFEGVPVGPLAGRAAIADAYASHPPDDEIVVLGAVEEGDGRIVAGYAWSRSPGTRAGELRLDLLNGRIARVTVTFE